MKRFRILLPVLAVASALMLFGCGNNRTEGNSPAETGRAAVTVVWPDPTARAVIAPAAANSLVVSIQQSNAAIAQVTINRPTELSIVTELALGPATVTIEAFSSFNGAGEILAVGNSSITIARNAPADISLALSSVISGVEIVPNTVVMPIGQSRILVAEAFDADGKVVLTAPGLWEWTIESLNNAVVIQPNGTECVVTANQIGGALVRARYAEFPIAATANIQAQLPIDGVSGFVRDSSNNPLPGANVTLFTSSGSVAGTGTADASGGFSFGQIAAGNYTVIVNRQGFGVEFSSFTYNPGSPVFEIFELAPPQQSPSGPPQLVAQGSLTGQNLGVISGGATEASANFGGAVLLFRTGSPTQIFLDPQNTFSVNVQLQPGTNNFVVVAANGQGISTRAVDIQNNPQ
ncbi:MAG: carboxypeptidase regulatory-like domain-containing protein [Fimbriimonadaceae bacterium]